MRALGVGPFATLVSSGALKDRQRIILADFVNHAPDSTLGPTLTEAFRVDLSQSRTVQLMDPQQVASTLQRMQRPENAALTPDVAREVAERAGVTATVDGQIDPVGAGYVLSASVVGVGDGRVLTAVRATANDDAHLIPALDKLSRDLRARIGESLVTIRKTPPLDQVTTSSLDALRKYTEADRRFDAGDYEGAIGLLHEAIARDSDFAMAYRKLAAALSNTGTSQVDMIAASRRAFQLRDRLPPLERDLTTAWYYDIVDYDITQAIAAYRSALGRDPDNDIALNNLALDLTNRREWAAAESLAVRGIKLGYSGSLYENGAAALAFQGRYGAADSLVLAGASRSPDDPNLLWSRALLAGAQGNYDRAAQLADSAAAIPGSGKFGIRQSESLLAAISGLRGRLAASAQHAQAFAQSGTASNALSAGAFEAQSHLLYQADTAAVRRSLDNALERHPLSSIPALDRPYSNLASAYAQAGRPGEARRLLDEYAQDVPEGLRKADFTAVKAEGDIAFAEGRWREAIADYRHWNDVSGCTPCGLFEIGRAFDRLGQTDSALANYIASTTTPAPGRVLSVGYAQAPAYHRIGEIYESQGDRTKALAYYQKFVDLWKDADPELQPLVRDARARIARLTAEH
jgi:eukaryotic-like serine/threonine-protein kinase